MVKEKSIPDLSIKLGQLEHPPGTLIHRVIDEPALDLGIVGALVSSHRNVPLPHDLAIFGEVGLLGEVRSVSQPDVRAREAATLGFTKLAVPQANAAEIRADLEVIPIRRVDEFVGRFFR